MSSDIIMYKKPEVLGYHKCLVCENPDVVIGYDRKKRDYIYSNKLNRITVSSHWLFFCGQCYYDLKEHFRKNKK